MRDTYSTIPANWSHADMVRYAERHNPPSAQAAAPSVHMGPSLPRIRDPEPQSAPSATGLAVRSLSGAKARANGALAGNRSHRQARIKRALEDA